MCQREFSEYAKHTVRRLRAITNLSTSYREFIINYRNERVMHMLDAGRDRSRDRETHVQ